MTGDVQIMVQMCPYNGQLRRTLIDFIDLKGRHTRANIADSVYAALPKCNCVSKICPFTTDSASTNFRAMDLLRERMVVTFAHLGCAGHKLHLSVTNSFGLCVTESASVEDIGRSQEDIESGSNDGNDDVPHGDLELGDLVREDNSFLGQDYSSESESESSLSEEFDLNSDEDAAWGVGVDTVGLDLIGV
ncbi:hypothetical protein Pmar_PMAR023987 [Perkinsus marinus ATCC 50983]|uniref:DUF659 domain-containing protein n=1 Tax=Perkinsus marinus (strain ATCC 50983 / TXsc) TaxID=423536 RepID=C5L353_PERM5|nr:hypothetical protein Pmar_PMAR023987 [Perkinsus marinus ATCC 50983]EER08848.1 hypothetical protein Pmar_PMAR023987 [Perkinsus marinus ATCC 50983]|eukprot:XP_002777032.1 hypothetical protein Pmar_PMAR023987 [Perkinsus marinus ATCC 50983]